MTFPEFSVSAGVSLVWAFLLLFRNMQLEGKASGLSLGTWGEMVQEVRQGTCACDTSETRRMINLVVPHPVRLKHSSLALDIRRK